MSYEKMTDQEINVAVADLDNYLAVAILKTVNHHSGLVTVYFGEHENEAEAHDLDYCGSWADAGPIIERFNIALSPMYCGGWDAKMVSEFRHDGGLRCNYLNASNNPRRAAMICYLKMEDAK